MRAVVQRVRQAKVTVCDNVVGAIGSGLVVFLGVASCDVEADAAFLAEKIANLRIFSDQNGKLNHSAIELQNPVLVVSQFTLYGDCRKGRRPNFSAAAPPELGERLYDCFVQNLRNCGLTLATGRFRSEMLVEIANDGPVTILLDSAGHL